MKLSKPGTFRDAVFGKFTNQLTDGVLAVLPHQTKFIVERVSRYFILHRQWRALVNSQVADKSGPTHTGCDISRRAEHEHFFKCICVCQDCSRGAEAMWAKPERMFYQVSTTRKQKWQLLSNRFFKLFLSNLNETISEFETLTNGKRIKTISLSLSFCYSIE